MADAPRLGARVRALRRREGLTQAAMAGRLGISASYLNLIEHNRRPLSAAVLIKLARVFGVDVAEFAGEDVELLSSELMEAFADPLFDEHGLRAPDVRELVGQQPQVARAVLALYAAWREGREAAGAASDSRERAAQPRLPTEEVSALLHHHGNHFPTLEAQAESLRATLGAGSLEVALTRYLEDRVGVAVREAPVGEMDGRLRRLDREGGRLWLSEALALHSRAFQLAHVLGLLRASREIDAIIESNALAEGTAHTLARVALANYFAAAVLMPYGAFLGAAEGARYDVQLLSHRFRVSFEQVCHRLTTLSRPKATGVPFHLIRVDIAGNISKRYSGSGIPIARFSGACPRWNVHAAFMTPGRLRVQLSQMPDGQVYFCVARTVQRAGAGFHDSQTLHAVGLGCRVEHAHRLVYADGVNLETVAVPVGVTCRLCPRLDCAYRAMPPVEHPLDVDEDVRGLSFYASTRGG